MFQQKIATWTLVCLSSHHHGQLAGWRGKALSPWTKLLPMISFLRYSLSKTQRAHVPY